MRPHHGQKAGPGPQEEQVSAKDAPTTGVKGASSGRRQGCSDPADPRA